MDMLTKDQAYAAMFYYLKLLYDQTKSDALGSLLGDLSLMNDDLPFDRAVIEDWNKAVELALKYGKAERQQLKK